MQMNARDTQDMVLAIMDTDSTPCTGPGVEGRSQEEDSGCESFPTNVQESLKLQVLHAHVYIYIKMYVYIYGICIYI